MMTLNGTFDSSCWLLDHVTNVTSLQQHLTMTRFIIQRVITPCIISFGLVANSLTIAVLTRRNMKSSTNTYLTALAVFDTLYLLFAFTMTLVHYDTVRDASWYIRYRLPAGRPLTDTASNTGVWLILTFTIERYLSVRLPLKAKIWCTPRRAFYILVVVCIATFLLTAPEFGEFQIITQSRDSNDTKLVLIPNTTSFGASRGYQLGYTYLNQALFTFLPLVLMFIFNSLLINVVLRASRRRSFMSTTSTKSPVRNSSAKQRLSSVSGMERHKSQNEQRITIMLISVVVVFLVCQLPQAVQKLYTVYLQSVNCLTIQRRLQLMITGNYFNLLVIINSSVNFILYSCLSTKFRHSFLRLFGCRCNWFMSRDSSVFRSSASERQSMMVGSV